MKCGNLKTLRSKISFFLLRAYFCEKTLNNYLMHFSWMLKKKNVKQHFAGKSHSVFEGLKGGPFEYTTTFFFHKFFLKKCFQHSLKMHWIPIQEFCHKNMHKIKKKDIFDRKIFKSQRFSNVFPNVGGNSLFWRGL